MVPQILHLLLTACQGSLGKETVLGLLLDSPVTCELERLNTSFHKRTETTAGMRAAVHVVRTSLKRDEASFKALFEEATAVVQSVGVKPITILQTRPPPKRFIEGAEAHQPQSAKDQFFKVLDVVEAQLSELFNQGDLMTWT